MIVHLASDETYYTLCGAVCLSTALATEEPGQVTCKRCLASLAKRDREFRRKARAAWPKYYPNRFGVTEFPWNPCYSLAHYTAPAAIAREEGRED